MNKSDSFFKERFDQLCEDMKKVDPNIADAEILTMLVNRINELAIRRKLNWRLEQVGSKIRIVQIY